MKLNSVNFGENGLELFAKIPYNNVKLNCVNFGDNWAQIV